MNDEKNVGSDIISSGCQAGPHGPCECVSELIGDYIVRFEGWVRDDFRKIIRSLRMDEDNPAELTAIVLPWTTEAQQLAAQGMLRVMTTCEAGRLLGIINLALDEIEHACDSRQIAFVDILALLYPIEDLVVALRIAQFKRQTGYSIGVRGECNAR